MKWLKKLTDRKAKKVQKLRTDALRGRTATGEKVSSGNLDPGDRQRIFRNRPK